MPDPGLIQRALTPRAGARHVVALATLLVLSLLVIACDRDDVTGEPIATPSPAAGEPNGATGDDGDASERTEEVEGDAPVARESREIGVLTVSTRLELPRYAATAPDGSRLVITEAGRILHDDGEGFRGLGRLADGAAFHGFAVDPAFPDEPHVYVLLERGERLEVHRLVLEDGALESDGVAGEAPLSGARWPGNGLSFGSDGVLYAALGDANPHGVALDLEALVAGEAVDPGNAPCHPHEATDGAGLGPWVAVGGEADGASLGASRWMIDGAVAVAVYDGEGIPQWHGDLFVVTEEGDLLRVPHGDDGCLDFASAEVLYAGDYGRIRDVTVGADGDLYLVTANGVGATHPNDDRVLRVGPIEEFGLLYPDLRTQPPANLQFDQGTVESGERRPVLRFTNTVMNLGDGPLEIRTYGGDLSYQRIYTADGSYLERPSGRLTEHWSHAHFHFEDLNRFELWQQESYERMLEGDEDAEPEWVEDKVSMCLMDLVPVTDDPHPGAYASECVQGAQGISVGWGDVYFFDIDEQWVVLDGTLQDGDYVIRSIVDAENLFHESVGGHDADRESHEANGATTWFTIAGGQLTVTHTESGAGEAWAP